MTSLGLLLTGLLTSALPASGEIVLPSETCRGVFFVPVTFEGGKTLELLLDTGASRSYLDVGAARRLLGDGAGGAKFVLKEARIGDFELGDLTARVLQLETIGLAFGRNVDGILGFPEFRDVLLTLDYPREEVRVSRGRLPRPDGDEIFPYQGWRRPFIDVEIGGRSTKLLLDSGATGGFALLADRRLVWSVAPRPSRTAVAVGRVIVRSGGRLSHPIRVGPIEFEEPVVTMAVDEALAGRRILRHFALTFDQREKRIRMVPRSDGAVRMEPWVGMGFGTRPRRNGLEVVRVFAGTSAEAAGLEAGDLIVEIDGTPVHQRGCTDLLGEAPGRPVVLTYLRDGDREQASIVTEAIIP